MLRQIDDGDSFLDSAKCRVGDCCRRPDERQYAAVMIRILLAVEQHDVGNGRDRLDDGVDPGGIAPLGKVRDTLD
jgi:hypothetical protein